MKQALLFGVISLLLIGVASMVDAHQPRIVSEPTTTITNPTVSQAFYGELTGEPARFVLTPDDNQTSLYVGLLVPDMKDISTDISAKVYHGTQLVVDLQAPTDQWKKWHEEFANDDYLQGPEQTIPVTPGEYRITVDSPSNEGKYVLVVGVTESFPFSEIVNAAVTVPRLKANFFDKPWWTALVSRSGMMLIGGIAGMIGVLWALLWLVRAYIVRKHKKGIQYQKQT